MFLNRIDAKQIDELCDRFEAQLRSGRNPVLRDFLNAVPADLQEYLIVELLSLSAELLPQDQWKQFAQACEKQSPQYREVIAYYLQLSPLSKQAGPFAGGFSKSASRFKCTE